VAVFRKSSWLPADIWTLWRWHEDPQALPRLTPPGERLEVLERKPGHDGTNLGEGAMVRLRAGRMTLEAVHRECRPPELFTDELVRGPFAHWLHRHRFEAEERDGKPGTRMTDEVEWRLPLAPVSHWLAGWAVRRRLNQMFAYRHEVLQQAFSQQPKV
jgi:ligand-binding SRPBCC domain-containing protein